MREVEVEVDPVPAAAPHHSADVARLREIGDVLADLVHLGDADDQVDVVNGVDGPGRG
jgi:hypothetical protein